MKHRAVFKTLLLAFLIAIFAFAGCAQASYAPRTASLQMQVATRTGPGTDYNELGTYFNNSWYNLSVTAYSKAYNSGVCWVQVEFSYGGYKIRAYTGLQRLKIDENLLPTEQLIGSGSVNAQTQAYTGPGTDFKPTTYKIAAGTRVDVFDTENGYAQVEYLDSYSRFMHRCWVPLSALSWTSNSNYQPYATPNYAPVVTPTPAPSVAPTSNYGGWDDSGWNSGYYTGEVDFKEGDTYVWEGSGDTGFVVTSNVDINGIAMIELDILGEITYHNLYLYMDTATQGSFMTLDGREGVIRFFDDYAILQMDLSFAAIGTEFMMARQNAAE